MMTRESPFVSIHFPQHLFHDIGKCKTNKEGGFSWSTPGCGAGNQIPVSQCESKIALSALHRDFPSEVTFSSGEAPASKSLILVLQ